MHPAAEQRQQQEDRSIAALQDALSAAPLSSLVDTQLQPRHDGFRVIPTTDSSAALSVGSTPSASVSDSSTAACGVHDVGGDEVSSDDEAYEPLLPLAAVQAAAGQLHAAGAMQQGQHNAAAPVPAAHAWPLLLVRLWHTRRVIVHGPC